MKRHPLPVLAALATLLLAADAKDPLNGFRIERHSVPREAIRAGGPGRDPLPEAKAEYAAAADASWVEPQTPVIGLFAGGQARAYPVHLMEYHQLVSDELGGVPVVVTYDPLTGTPRAFRRDVDGRILRFGISGLVYNSNFLLYDRETESLWSQFRGDAISGELSGRRLAPLPLRQETLARWLERHPESRVLVRPRPKEIDYRYSPYKAYWLDDQIPYPVAAQDPRFHAKELVLGVEVQGRTRAYLGSLLTRAGHRAEDELEGRRIRIEYDPDAAVFVWEAPDDVVVTDAYWFAWKAFHPDTEVWHDAGGTLPSQEPIAAGSVRSLGTSFAVRPDGVLLTAYHLVRDARSIRVRFPPDDWKPAELESSSASNDVAVLRVQAKTPRYLSLAPPRSVTVGQRVFTIGFPVADLLGTESRHRDGTISALSGLPGERSLLQIDVPIQPGNSGGPLVNEGGEVVGIVTSSADVASFFQATGALPQNVNWAIDADFARPLFEPAPSQQARSREDAVEKARAAVLLVEATH